MRNSRIVKIIIYLSEKYKHMATSKTSTSELFNRYIWLANIVYSAGKITFEEIANKWRNSYWNNDKSNLPLRTFHDHRKAIEQMFDINIECDKHDGFKYYIENNDDIEKGNLRRWLLGTMSVSNSLSESKNIRNRILLEDIPSGMNYLTLILDAMQQGNVLEVSHKGFWSNAENTFRVEPYCLKLFHQRWYLLGHSIEIDEVRVYALDRITDCHLTKLSFRMPEKFDCEAYFSEYYGVFTDSSVKPEIIKLRVDGVTCNYLRSLPLHHSQQEIETVDDHCIFQYFLRPTNDFINELVSMSPDAKVIFPKWLADKINERIREMIASD